MFQPAERGIALLIVVSILTVVGILGVAFAFSLHLETQATRQFIAATQARYLAEAGVSHARALLDEDRDNSRIDDLTEPWARLMQGVDADVDRDGERESGWWPVVNGEREGVGRYALLITDESGKANLNVAQAKPSAGGVGALNLTTLFTEASFAHPAQAAEAVERFRYGEDGQPGAAGVDDDGDGSIDEPDEYQPWTLRGDDRQLESLEDLTAVTEISPDDLRKLSALGTVYSWEQNVSVTGAPRVNVNTATADELLAALFEIGVSDPWQMAVNMADYVDADFALSRVTKTSQNVLLSNRGGLGSWAWSAQPDGHYHSDEMDGAPLIWDVPVPTGRYRVLARGLPGVTIGDITIEGQTFASVDDGQSLGLFDLHDTLRVEVANHESGAASTSCAFRGLELVPETPSGGISIRGIEAVRLNELMVDPVVEFEAANAVFDPQTSDWTCPGEGVCRNSGVGQARWVWATTLPAGRYYLRVYGSAPGQTIGEVRLGSSTALLSHGQIHPEPVTIGSDGKVTLTSGKTAADGTYYLKKVSLSLQPDAEYVELINLSDKELDISGWTIEGELTGGRRARLPLGSKVKPHGLLVAAVDLDDGQAGLSRNGIDARSAWQIPPEATAVQLEFTSGAPTPDDDWLKTSVPPGGRTRLLLRDQDQIVDEVEYPLPPHTLAPLQSLEKGDPSTVQDSDGDGVDDVWYPSLALAYCTPGMPNDNDGLKETVGLEVVTHDPSKEVTVLSHPLDSVGELAGLPSGKRWRSITSTDLARLVDRFTVEGVRLEAEGRLISGQGAWEERSGGYYEYNNVAQPAVPGIWEWRELVPGVYRLHLYTWPGEQVSVRWKLADGSWTTESPALSAEAQGRIALGQVRIGPAPASQGGADVPESERATQAQTLTLEATCASPSGVCHLDAVQLDPKLLRVGPVNMNTAPLGVLMSLPGMTEALAARVIAGRPYGDQDHKARGIGDLLLASVLASDEEEKLAAFRRLAHLLTTRSDVFRIQSLGQAMTGDRVMATQRITTIVERR